MSRAPDIRIVDRSNVPSWAAAIMPLNDPVNSTVLTLLTETTAWVRMSFGSVRAGAWGVEPQAARTIESVARSARGMRMRRRVTEFPLEVRFDAGRLG